MKVARCHLKSKSPYGPGRYHKAPELEKESKADYEERTWRERCHTDKDGILFIPPMAFKHCIAEAAKYLGDQIPGKGKSTYPKHMKAGVMVVEPVSLGIHKDDVECERLFVPAGNNSPNRVEKVFPVVKEWEGTVEILIYDDTITEKVLERFLREAGMFIGVGRFRPINNGYYGRFDVESIEWSDRVRED